MTEFLVDTREQRPLYKGTKKKLNVGDYTTVDLQHFFCIERKSPHDLYGTITRGHARFKKEILRAQAHNIQLVVVVECTKKYFLSKAFDRMRILKVKSTSLARIIATLERRYELEFVWCRTRSATAKYVKKRLLHEEKYRAKNSRVRTEN